MLTALLPVLLGAAPIADEPLAERVPGMIEACLHAAVAADQVSETADSHKYMCTGRPARRLWDYLEAAGLPSWEQEVTEGRWLSRAFPLGGCFKELRGPDGAPSAGGLSCSIWVPRRIGSRAAAPSTGKPAD